MNIKLTTVELQQQWTLERRFNNKDQFVYKVTTTDGVAYFDNARRAVQVYDEEPEMAVVEIEGKLLWGHGFTKLYTKAPELLLALTELRNWHKSEYQSNPEIDAKVDALIEELKGK